MNQQHIPVLASETLDQLNPCPGDHYLDLTAGYGGHATLVWNRIKPSGKMTLVDRDQNAISALQSLYGDNQNVEFLHEDFLSASNRLLKENRSYDLILADLGLSSPHIDKAERGFSFGMAGPLDMRMDPRQALTAADLVNKATAEELVRIFRDYGEITGANRLARRLIERRPFTNTTELALAVARIKPSKNRIHPATKVFQALRIAVNDEIRLLEQSLPLWLQLLKPGGRLAVISFHSLEDRLVKQLFNEHGGPSYDATLEILTKKPVGPGAQETVFNPRARSAKLRSAQRK